MNNKRAIIITAIVLIMLCISIAAVYGGYSYYIGKSEIPPSPYTMEDIQNSNAAYLLAPDFEVTTENIKSVLQSYFSAPTRLSYTFYSPYHFPDNSDINYKCDELKVNATFGKIFTDKTFFNTEEQANNVKPHGCSYNFYNDIGVIDIVIHDGKSYIGFSKFAFGDKGFFVDEILINDIDAVIEKALPESMEVTPEG